MTALKIIERRIYEYEDLLENTIFGIDKAVVYQRLLDLLYSLRSEILNAYGIDEYAMQEESWMN